MLKPKAKVEHVQDSPINAPVRNPQPAQSPRQPRARGSARLSSKPLGARAVLDQFRQSGSLKVVYPQSWDNTLQAVVVNTAGGITGGDEFTLEATAGAHTTLTLTTQAAERAYRAAPADGAGVVENRLHVETGARLNWLPQETILFDGCALQRRLQVTLAADAKLLLVEPMVFGRAAMGESVDHGLLKDRIEIHRDNAPIFLDAVHLEGDIARQLSRPAVADGAGAMATVVFVTPEAEAHLAPVRAMLKTVRGGATLLARDVLFLRALAADSFELRKALMPVLTRLSGAELPRPWMI